MTIFREIKAAIVDENSALSPVLLKLKLLEAQLDGAITLEEWVKHEAEGYPEEIDVPPYRVVDISYTGIFMGDGDEPKKAPIDSSLIKEHVGEEWTKHKVREGVFAIEEIEKGLKEGKEYGIGASQLLPKLPAIIYENYSCKEMFFSFSPIDFYGIKQGLRYRLIELVSKIEQYVPGE